MRCNVLRFAISSLVVVLIILQLIHLTMISWLENQTANLKRGTNNNFFHDDRNKNGAAAGGDILVAGGRSNQRIKHGTNSRKVPQQQASAFHIPDAKLDTSGTYKIYPYFMKSVALDDVHHGAYYKKDHKDLTLVTQCSLHHLGHIVDLVDRWKGPVSVSIFGLASEINAISTVIFSLRECYSDIKQNVSFHLVHPITEVTDDHGARVKSTSFTKLPCDTILRDLWDNRLFARNYAQEGVAYPNNLLRNVARAGTTSKYVFVIDIDMLPSTNMRTGFLHLGHSSILLQEETEYSRKTVFVVPAFEVLAGVVLPTDKPELLELLRQGTARQFYVTDCSYCQNHTDYHKWENIQVIR